jgi:hypothetical protein
MNVQRKDGFTQVCVWEGTTLGENTPEDFEEFIAKEFAGVRAQFLEVIETNSDVGDNGKPVKGTGGRSDLFFAIHDGDVGKFAVPRLAYGIRWVEDVYGNRQAYLYPERVKDYQKVKMGLTPQKSVVK